MPYLNFHPLDLGAVAQHGNKEIPCPQGDIVPAVCHRGPVCLQMADPTHQISMCLDAILSEREPLFQANGTSQASAKKIGKYVWWGLDEVYEVDCYKSETRSLSWGLGVSSVTCDNCDEKLPSRWVSRVSKQPPVYTCRFCSGKIDNAIICDQWRVRLLQSEVFFMHSSGRCQWQVPKNCSLEVCRRLSMNWPRLALDCVEKQAMLCNHRPACRSEAVQRSNKGSARRRRILSGGFVSAQTVYESVETLPSSEAQPLDSFP